MKIIALTGCKMVGKSTVAQAIADESDKAVHIISFADPMRAMLQAMGVRPENLNMQSLKEEKISGLGKSARYLMQTLGTEWGRGMIANDIWLWAMQHQIELEKEAGAEIVVIDDLRFENEADWITSVGGYVVRLKRDGYNYGFDPHSTEKPLPIHKTDLTYDASDEDDAAKTILSLVE